MIEGEQRDAIITPMRNHVDGENARRRGTHVEEAVVCDSDVERRSKYPDINATENVERVIGSHLFVKAESINLPPHKFTDFTDSDKVVAFVLEAAKAIGFWTPKELVQFQEVAAAVPDDE